MPQGYDKSWSERPCFHNASRDLSTVYDSDETKVVDSCENINQGYSFAD